MANKRLLHRSLFEHGGASLWNRFYCKHTEVNGSPLLDSCCVTFLQIRAREGVSGISRSVKVTSSTRHGSWVKPRLMLKKRHDLSPALKHFTTWSGKHTKSPAHTSLGQSPKDICSWLQDISKSSGAAAVPNPEPCPVCPRRLTKPTFNALSSFYTNILNVTPILFTSCILLSCLFGCVLVVCLINCTESEKIHRPVSAGMGYSTLTRISGLENE